MARKRYSPGPGQLELKFGVVPTPEPSTPSVAADTLDDVASGGSSVVDVPGEIVAETVLSTLNLEDFSYHCDVNSKSGDFGNCVMYITPDKEIHLTGGRSHAHFSDKTINVNLRSVLQERSAFCNSCEYLWSQAKRENFKFLGGGTYFAKDGRVVLVDSGSTRFGEMDANLVEMHAVLVARCLHAEKLTLEIIDNQYFAPGTPEQYLENRLR
jgi:hypothetical protein